MANGDLIKLGTFYLAGTKKTRPTKPWRSDVTPPGAPSVGDIPSFSAGQTIEIRDTDANDAYKIQWREVNDGGKKLLICDRVLLANVSWDDLNAQGLVTGKTITIDGQQYKLRLLTGGSNYRSGTDAYSGGFPTTNEWDRIIVNEAGFSGLPTPAASDLDTTQNSTDFNSAHNQYWNWFYIYSWAQETYTGNSAYRALRGYDSARNWNYVSAAFRLSFGWRPALEVLNSAPSVALTNPANNLLGTDGNCEDTSKFTYTGGTAALDSTRKTQGNNSIKVTKSSASTYVDPQSSRRIYPAVGECYIVIADVYLENSATSLYVSSSAAGVSINSNNSKYVTGQLTGFVVSTTGVFIPVIRALEVTSVSSPGVSYFYPQIYHSGTSGDSFNVDSFRVFKITKAQYDALPTNVDLATAQAIAAQYPYIDPNNNQTLTEGNTYPIAGTATDADSGNVVTVKYKIDNGTAYNLTASVSDGTTPINFSKTLTYLNNRLYDGQNPVTPILDENVTHTLTVWAEDDQGGKSPDTTRNFTVLYNQPPEISGSDQDLGTITDPPSIQYSVTDVEGYSFTITEAVDGNTIRTFPGVDGQQETLTIPLEMWITLEPGVTHQLTITATDQYNATSVRTYTFIRAVEGIELETTEILPADAQPSRVILSLNGTIPANANLNVQVCNNAHDPSPTWEDMTDSVKNGRPYVFTNTTSTTGQWGIRFKISILPGV